MTQDTDGNVKKINSEQIMKNCCLNYFRLPKHISETFEIVEDLGVVERVQIKIKLKFGA